MNDTQAIPIAFLCGGIFLIAAVIMLVFPPKKINSLYGYRTSSSQKNQQNWDFAQRYSSWRMMEAAVFMIAVSMVLTYAEIAEHQQMIVGIITMGVGVAYMLLRTESAIKRKFPNK